MTSQSCYVLLHFFFFLAEVIVELENLISGEEIEDWFALGGLTPPIREDWGSLRVRIRYIHEVIMPLAEYNALKEVMLFFKSVNFNCNDIFYYNAGNRTHTNNLHTKKIVLDSFPVRFVCRKVKDKWKLVLYTMYIRYFTEDC